MTSPRTSLLLLLVVGLGCGPECPPNYPEPAPYGTTQSKCPPPAPTKPLPPPTDAPTCKTAESRLVLLQCQSASPGGKSFAAACEEVPRLKTLVACLSQASSCVQADACGQLVRRIIDASLQQRIETTSMISVIIPTHNPRYLRDTVKSVLAQTYQDFEIVLVPNGKAVQPNAALALAPAIGMTVHDVAEAMARADATREIAAVAALDPRILVRAAPEATKGSVGAIKRFGFDSAIGSILVELDHDDLLVPFALQEIADAFAADSERTFVYSNFAEFHDETWAPRVYDTKHGWVHRPVEALGHKLIELVSFAPTPASISKIVFAPNHVRAWTREGYKRAGGHDPAYSVCDDHDLVIRTYLNGTMHHIDKCLYLYRVLPDAQNTYLKRIDEITQKTNALYNNNIDPIIRHWCKLNQLPCYDLGGGIDCAPGWTSVDMKNGHISADLRETWPWPDSSVGAFRAYDLFEHLPDKMHTLSELHRCLVPGGWILSLTPSALGQGGFQDPTHVSYWVKNAFKYVTERALAKYIDNKRVRFQAHRLVEEFPSAWHKSENIPYVTFEGCALKDGYAGPGEVKI